MRKIPPTRKPFTHKHTSSMGWDKGTFEEHRRAQNQRRKKRLPIRADRILKLSRGGFIVQRLAPDRFLINDRLMLRPLHRNWYDLVTKETGEYKNVNRFVRAHFGEIEREKHMDTHETNIRSMMNYAISQDAITPEEVEAMTLGEMEEWLETNDAYEG